LKKIFKANFELTKNKLVHLENCDFVINLQKLKLFVFGTGLVQFTEKA
jgi:hypothetical protein